jgi:hypothetical protein
MHRSSRSQEDVHAARLLSNIFKEAIKIKTRTRTSKLLEVPPVRGWVVVATYALHCQHAPRLAS